MSIQPDQGGTPDWDMADRLRKGLREAGLGVAEMADYLGVSRTSVSNWINGRIEPGKQTVRLWALRCGVSFDWLCHGDNGPCFDGHLNGISAGQRGVITGRYSTSRPLASIGTRFIPASLPYLPVAA